MTEIAPGIFRSGSPDQPPLLLLHSSQSNSGQWRLLLQTLEPYFDLVAVDLLGYGKAPAVTPSDPQQFRFSDEIPRILSAVDSLSWQQPLTLVGHSYGGALALKFAVEQTFDLRSLVLFEPVAFHLLASTEAARQEIESISAQMIDADAQQATAAFVDYWNQPNYFAALPTKIQQVMTQQARKVQCDFAALMGESYTLRDCAVVTQPTLLLQGQFTQASARAVAHKLEVTLPAVVSQTLACGHMGPITHAVQVNSAIVEFLAAVYANRALSEVAETAKD